MFLLRWCQKTKMDKQKSPLPAGREAFQNAVPISCFARGACIAAQTEGIAPPTPGRIFPRRSTGRLAAQWPPLSAVDGMGYFSRSPWLAVYYISSDGGMCQGEVCGGWLLCALTGRFPLANEARCGCCLTRKPMQVMRPPTQRPPWPHRMAIIRQIRPCCKGRCRSVCRAA